MKINGTPQWGPRYYPPPPPPYYDPYGPSVFSRAGGGVLGAVVGSNVASTVTSVLAPQLTYGPAAPWIGLTGALVGGQYGWNSGIGRTALATAGGYIGGNLAYAATGSPLLGVVGMAGGAAVGSSLIW